MSVKRKPARAEAAPDPKAARIEAARQRRLIKLTAYHRKQRESEHQQAIGRGQS